MASYSFSFSSDAAEIPEDAGFEIEDLLHYYPPGHQDEDSDSDSESDTDDEDIISIASTPADTTFDDITEPQDAFNGEPEPKRRCTPRYLSKTERANVDFLARFHQFTGSKLNVSKVCHCHLLHFV